MGLNATRKRLIYDLFLNSADDDYICARLSIQHSLDRHFAWNAAQALEKYTKCALLLLGKRAKWKHSFATHLIELVDGQFSGTFPETIDVSSFTKIRPGLEDYAKESFRDFIGRLCNNGKPDVRYNVSNNRIYPYDLQKLDYVVFLLRRLCFFQGSTDAKFIEHINKLRNDSNFTLAKDWPTLQGITSRTSKKIEALQFENCINFPERFETSRGQMTLSFHTAPQTAARAVSRLSDDDENWLRENVKL